MKKLMKGIIWGMMLSGIFAISAMAAQVSQEEFSVSIGSRHVYATDVHATDKELSVSETKFSATEEFKVGRVPLSLYLNNQHIGINEDIPLGLPTQLVATTVGLGVKVPMPFTESDLYYLGIDVLPSMYRDDWDWQSGSFRIPFRVYGIYRKSESLIWVAGAYVRPEFEDAVLPIIGLRWVPNDKWEVNMLSDEPNVTYKLNDQWSALAEMGFQNGEYEVTRGREENVILQYKSTSFGGGLKYALTENWGAKLSVGAVTGRQIRYRDNLGKVVPDAGLYTEFKLNGKF